MAHFLYKATDPKGKTVTATLEAADERAAASMVQAMGYIPIRIRATVKDRRHLNMDIMQSLGATFNRVSGKDVMLFTQDLATLLDAGLPVDRALSILIDVSEKETFKEVIRDVLKVVQGGGTLSDALAKYPNAFSRFYQNLVKAGEAGGVLESVLRRLGVFLESTQELKDFIKSALIYPIFLLTVGGISVIILMTFVIPRFAVIFEGLGQAIPLSTQILLGTSALVKSYWWAMVALVVGAWFLLARYKKSPAGRLKTDQAKLALPVCGDFIRKLEVARFSRTLGTLTKSGVPILKALDLVRGIISNQIIARSLQQVNDRVKEGDRLSKPLEDTGYFPALAIQMITVGEETGRLEEMLLRVADSYEKNLRSAVKRLVSILEPVMILFMGLVVAFIVISMLMAVFSMNEIPI